MDEVTFLEYLSYPFVRNALVAGVLISLCAALLGVPLVLRRLSFMGDGLSHVAFGAMAVAGAMNFADTMALSLPVTIAAALVLMRSGRGAKSFRAVCFVAAVFTVVCSLAGILIAVVAGTPVGSTIVAADIAALLLMSTVGTVLPMSRGGGHRAQEMKNRSNPMKRPAFNIKRVSAVSLMMAVVALCILNSSCDMKSGLEQSDCATMTNEAVKVDFDFTSMNSTMKVTYTYRLAANPKEFVGKTLRLSGMFLARVDKQDGKRYFGCLMGDPGGCSCCAPGGVLEFVPQSSYVWLTNFPPVESRITVMGRLEMFEVGSSEQSFTIPV